MSRETEPTHIFIDFDETIFNHVDYIQFAAGVMSAEFGIDPVPYMESFDSYHDVMDGFHRLYRHDDHIREQAGMEWSMISGVISERASQLSLDFCYDDAHRFSEEAVASGAIVRLLTYGDEAYQRYKISLCKEVAALPVHVVREPKAKFLERHFGGSTTRGILVDDKAPLHLPSNWEHAWINRDNRRVDTEYFCLEMSELNFDQMMVLYALAGTIKTR
jgi:hypothetical protein